MLFFTNAIILISLLLNYSTQPIIGEKTQEGAFFKEKFVEITSSVERYLPVDYVKDGSIDYTYYIQRAINSNSAITFPSFPLLVNDKGLIIGSDKTITFLKGSELRLKPSSQRGYTILSIKNSRNVTLINPVIKGDRYNHLGESGEGGMGIGISGSSNIKIYGARITECWGDGIYIGQIDNKISNSNILIKDAYLRKNRRDGISIITVDGLILENVYSGYNDGTSPKCGINFEPNNPQCEIKNVKILNPRTEHNPGSGIQIQLSTLLGGGDNKSNIDIINHWDNTSKSSAVKVAANRKSGSIGGSVAAVINFVNPSWMSTLSGRPLNYVTDQSGVKIRIAKPRIKDLKGDILTPSESRALLQKNFKGNLEVLTF